MPPGASFVYRQQQLAAMGTAREAGFATTFSGNGSVRECVNTLQCYAANWPDIGGTAPNYSAPVRIGSTSFKGGGAGAPAINILNDFRTVTSPRLHYQPAVWDRGAES